MLKNGTPPEKPKNGNKGQNGKYLTHVEPRLETIKAWRRKGLTEKEVCDNLGITVTSLANYKNKYPEVKEALLNTRDDTVAQVENALFMRAIGYEYEEEEVITNPDGGVRIKKVRKQMAPDVTAQIFILKNRSSQEWRDRREQALSGPDGKPLQNVIVYLPQKDDEGEGN